MLDLLSSFDIKAKDVVCANFYIREEEWKAAIGIKR